MTDQDHVQVPGQKYGSDNEHVGEPVIFTDPVGKKHYALVTAVWGNFGEHSVNLLYVEEDPAKHDQYGRQINRQYTSVVHRSSQSAHGMYYETVEMRPTQDTAVARAMDALT